MHRKWLVNRTNKEYVEYLSGALGVSSAFAQVLISRGLRTPEEAAEFVRPGALKDPYALGGMEAAVRVIGDAKRRGLKVLVHGDYDVDGVSATAIMVDALRAFGLEALDFIPNRFRHGYGFGPAAVELAKSAGAGLIITVDCGITSFEAVEAARREGIDVIVTDHHEPETSGERGVLLPEAGAVINPKIFSEDEALGAISGAGVALKLAQALLGAEALGYLDLAAIGALADIVPLIGENRVIVREGLGLIIEGKREGIKALKTASGLDGRSIKAGLLSFTMLPRMNAAGRLSEASEVVELLVTESGERAQEIAAGLNALNAERQKIEEEVYGMAMQEIQRKGLAPVLVLAGEGWHEGVIGIVASKMAEQFGRPAFVFSIKGERAKGSARGVPGLDLHGELSLMKELLVSFGGHKQAAGLKVEAAMLGAFEERICAAAQERLRDYRPSITIDADISLKDVNHGLIRDVESMEPFGHGNPEPLFGAKGLKALNPRVVGRNHLKMRLRDRTHTIEAIGFDMGGFLDTVDDTLTVDAVFVPLVNEWEGGRAIQLNLKALRPASA